jgi:hypothetical protein
MRGRVASALVAPALIAMALAGCAQEAPKGVDKAKLDAEISGAIGDSATCLLIAEQGGAKVVYRYNTRTVCARTLPACDRPQAQTLEDLLKATAKDGQPRTLSCNTTADASRGVGWASGVIAGKGLVYAAVMEGERALPGRIMASKLASAFRDAGV